MKILLLEKEKVERENFHFRNKHKVRSKTKKGQNNSYYLINGLYLSSVYLSIQKYILYSSIGPKMHTLFFF